MDTPVILHWPEDAKRIHETQNLVIATVDTPKTQKRTLARQAVRTALSEIIAGRLNCPANSVRLENLPPGQGLKLAPPHQNIGVSFSHESTCSVIAINLVGPIGIDLLQMESHPAWAAEIRQLASDYLGQETSLELESLSEAQRPVAFARHWVKHEARLKCLGQPLVEWSASLRQAFTDLSCLELPRIEGMYAAIAFRHCSGLPVTT